MPSVSRDSLKKALDKGELSATQQELAQLRLDYSYIAMLYNTFIGAIRDKEKIFPTILPTQSSGRWSYLNPPLSNFPKRCINPECLPYHHERTAACWSLRDCLRPTQGTFWIEHDLDAVEHRIYCLLLKWRARLEDMRNGIDIHTPVTCSLFNLPLPSDLRNPHSSDIDTVWRKVTQWQGKDDTRRTMSKNFTYGGQYFYVSLAKDSYKPRLPNRVYCGLVYNPHFVYSIPNIQSYLIKDESGVLVPPDYESLAVRFVESNIEIQKRKAEVMEKCRKDGFSRTLYGGLRRAYFKNQDSAKELFNHIIQGTVASYINESCILLQRHFPESYLIHNQHDSLKWAFQYQSTTQRGKEQEESQILHEYKKLCQRVLEYEDESIEITATFKITRREES